MREETKAKLELKDRTDNTVVSQVNALREVLTSSYWVGDDNNRISCPVLNDQEAKIVRTKLMELIGRM